MKKSHGEQAADCRRVSGRGVKLLKNAVARRKLQEMRDERVLRSWLAEVWEQSTWSDEFDRSGRFH